MKLSFEHLKLLWKMEHLLQKSKCSIFHNIFKYMIFQRHYYGVKTLKHEMVRVKSAQIFEVNMVINLTGDL